MNTEIVSQKERFLQEVEQKLLRKELDARLLEDGLIRVKWNGQPLCSVDRDGIVRFRPADITGPEVDRQLRTVIQTAGHVKEYMRIFERAPALKAIGLEDSYKVLADFGDAVLAGQLGKKGAKDWRLEIERRKCTAERKISARGRTEAPAQGAGRKAAGRRSGPRQLERKTALLG